MRIAKRLISLLKPGYLSVSSGILRLGYPLLRRMLRNKRALTVKKVIAMALVPAFLAGKRPQRHFESETIFGFRIAGDTRDIIPAIIDFLGVFEENLSYWFIEQLRPGDVFVDVGAHVGYFSLLASVSVGASGRVIAIEASPATFGLLMRNISLNPKLKNIRAVNCAASDVEGRVKIYRGPKESTGLTSIFPRKGNIFEAEVGTKPLVEILTTAEIQRMRIVKIDVEGAEFHVVEGLFQSGLRGMREDLEIIVETSKDWTYRGQRGSVDKMINMFRHWGFNAYAMKKQFFVNPATMFRPVRIKEDPCWGYFDLIFSRRDRERL